MIRFPALAVLFASLMALQAKDLTILNVSYDATRELYREMNAAFADGWREKTGQKIMVRQSHGGSGKQARAVIDGLQADVVTLALAYDVDALHQRAGLIPADWQKRLPYNSAPYFSTIVFLTRKGNPKGVKDWEDLAKPGLAVITPNPRTSGGARWNYLAAWAWALRRHDQNEQKAREFLTRLYKNVPVLDSGARGATITFVQREIGDVLLCWESEALLIKNQLAADKVELVVPSSSILAEPPVALVDQVVDVKATRSAAEAYLQFLYTPQAQALAANHYYRPRLREVAEKYSHQFPAMKMISIDEIGGWASAHKKHFTEGGLFDQIYKR